MQFSPALVISESRELRLATLEDLKSLVALEHACFDEDRRDTRATIRNCLNNSHHETWVEYGHPDQGIGVAISLRITHHTLRIFSLATHPDWRGQGWGNHLIAFARVRARARHCRQLSLEADASHPMLIDWYQRKGFHRIKYLADYYALDRHAWRMRCLIGPDE